LLAERKADGVALPSIRSLAAHFGVAPLTIHRALRVLQEGGRVHAVSRKGFFWGKEPIAVASLPRRSDRLAQTRERLVSDLRSGVFHPHRELPSRLALSQIYGIAPGRIGALLDELAESGTLLRRGRGFALPTPPRRAEEGTVLVVSRCDASGTLLLETERQTDFVKSVHREGRERALRIVVLGWCQDEGSGAFLNQDGVEVEPRSVPGILLGCLVSTWLVRDPRVLLGDLGKLRVPISVWWEHPPGEFPSGGSWKAPVLGFNISFGPSSGVVVGRHLRSAGTGPIAFVSPFHGGDWSRARLEGLLEGLRGTDIEIVPFVDEARASAWEHHQAEGGVAAGERRIRDILADFLDRRDLERNPVWVAVNDHTAVVLLDVLRERGRPRPYIVSFDNSSISDAHQIDSFEFHTEGMVRQMLYHVLHPKAHLFRDGGLHEMVGRLVLRT
jgi:DNA-binding transcriptional regulator YhcF (GntR family)